jgi:hypothetical protein
MKLSNANDWERLNKPKVICKPPFKPQSLLDRFRYLILLTWNWTYSNVHLLLQTYYVLDFIYLHKLKAGKLAADHPWVTGISPQTGEYIWPKNIVYASSRKPLWNGSEPEADSDIVIRIGKFLTAMIKRSTFTDPEIPQGPKRRMPHAVNLLHGPVHYNGGFLLFNDFQDGMFHLSDPAFIKEIKRFARNERRELTIILRERSYDPEEFAWFVAFVRSHLPWYANGNGPTKKRVLHGTPSPYPAVNPINGSWVRDVKNLVNGYAEKLIKPPIEVKYFRNEYRGNQSEFTFLERFHAWAQSLIIQAKGFQGGLVFTKRKKIERENWEIFLETGGQWQGSYLVSHPFVPRARIRQQRREKKQDS